jgi:hypothetical protein
VVAMRMAWGGDMMVVRRWRRSMYSRKGQGV